tara:strand:- start:19 stop:243 length:225 start_codon:yes stop_codon:yes gene_type:complete
MKLLLDPTSCKFLKGIISGLHVVSVSIFVMQAGRDSSLAISSLTVHRLRLPPKVAVGVVGVVDVEGEFFIIDEF